MSNAERPKEFDKLLVEYLGFIKAKAWRYCKTESDACDLAQQSIERCLKYWYQWDSSRYKIASWLALTVKSTFYKSRKDRNEIALTHEDISPSSQESFSQITSLRAVLTEREYNALLMIHEGFSQKEVGDSVGVSGEMIRRALRKARIKLGVDV